MDWIQALIMGIVQGLTEYLPVSSSGHLAILGYFFDLPNEESVLTFTVVLHVATVLSTVVILWREIIWLFSDLFKWKWNDGTKYIVNIIISMIPVGIVGLTVKDTIEAAFNGLLVVGICLLCTAALLAFAYYAKPRQRSRISPLHAFFIGIAQAVACLPGLSRSGSTIATGLLLGNKKETLAQFSFLMVIPPILGMALLDIKDIAEMGFETAMAGIPLSCLIIGFLSAFIVGCLACKWMINIVKKGKLVWFALYCAIIGAAAIVFNFLPVAA